MLKTGINKKCLKCGQDFYVPGWRLKDKTRGKYCSRKCAMNAPSRIRQMREFGKRFGFTKGYIPHNWKGENVGYFAMHSWVRRHKGKPKKCEHCGSIKRLTWSNISRVYKRDLADWISLCQGCNLRYDHGYYGSIKKRFKR